MSNSNNNSNTNIPQRTISPPPSTSTAQRKNLRELFALRSELTRRVEALKNACVIEKNLVQHGHHVNNHQNNNNKNSTTNTGTSATTTTLHRKKRSSGSTFHNVDQKHLPVNHNNNEIEDMKEKVFGAVMMEDPEYLYTVLSQGADPDCRDWSNRTPLHVACYAGSDACVELLIEFGANVNAIDDKNQTPREVAIFHGHQAIASILDPAKVDLLLASTTASKNNINNKPDLMMTTSNHPSSPTKIVHGEIDSTKYLISPRSNTSSATAAAAEHLEQLALPSSSANLVHEIAKSDERKASEQQQEEKTNNNNNTQTNSSSSSSSPIMKSIWEKQKHPSAFRAVGDTESVVVCMVGLPGRGKSFLSGHCARFLRWKGVPTQVFNAGDYRRRILGAEGTHDPSFYDEKNEHAKELREQMAHLACEDAAKFIKRQPVAVAFIDATNTNRARRKWLLDFFCPNIVPISRILFIESVCDDDDVISQNILRDKVTNGDYKGKPPKEVLESFHNRIEKYRQQYEPIDLEHDETLSFLRVINLKQTLVANRIQGRLQTLISSFITNLHPVAQSLYLVVPGPFSRTQLVTFAAGGGTSDSTSSPSTIPQARQTSATNKNVVNLDELVAAAQRQFGPDRNGPQQEQQNTNTNNNISSVSRNSSNQNLASSIHQQVSSAVSIASSTAHHANVSTADSSSMILPHIPSTILTSSNVASNQELEALGEQIAHFVREKINKTKAVLQSGRKRFCKEEMKRREQEQQEQDEEDDDEQAEEDEEHDGEKENNSKRKSANIDDNKKKQTKKKKGINNSSFDVPNIFDDHDDNKFLIAYAEDFSSEKTANAVRNKLNEFHTRDRWNLDPRIHGNGEEEEDCEEEEEEQEEEIETDEHLLDDEVVERTSNHDHHTKEQQQLVNNLSISSQPHDQKRKNSLTLSKKKNKSNTNLVNNVSFNSSVFDERTSIYVHIQIESVQWLQAMSYGLCEGMTIAEAERDYPVIIQSAFQPHTSEPLVREELSGPDAFSYLQQHNRHQETTTTASTTPAGSLNTTPITISDHHHHRGTTNNTPQTISGNNNTSHNINNNTNTISPSSNVSSTIMTEQEMMKTYVTSYPKGESLRQVAVRVSNMVMQWKRIDSPLLCICSVAPATLLVAFAADLPPECACQLRLPRNTIIEVTAKHALVLRSLLKYISANSTSEEEGGHYNYYHGF